MPQLLLELLSEEIPARMQARAEADLARLLGEKLAAAGFAPESLRTFAGPRRLVAVVEGLPVRQPDVEEEKKGPRVGAPEAAVQGFLRAAGLSLLDQAEVIEDKKGAFYVARISRIGRPTAEIVHEIVPEILRSFPWPKSMRSDVSEFYWVRPLKRILCIFDGAAVDLAFENIPSGALSEGHRFHAPGLFVAIDFEDYRETLQRRFVILDREARKAQILAQARDVCARAGLELVEDAGLLEETAGLAEWPVALMGEMEPAFLALPGEVIRLTMRSHQKYFAVRDPATGKLAPKFVFVANLEAKDGGEAIIRGNARVLAARLNDARFFWEQDLRLPLDAPVRVEKLKGLVFHQKLGSVWDKVERITALAKEIAPACGADPDLAERAARLCKMDLVTETVGEFPELQGQIGRQIFEARSGTVSSPVHGGGGARSAPEGGAAKTPPQSAARTAPPQAGEQTPHFSIAAAIEDHYRPVGPSDRTPTDPVAIAVALADKLDTLTGFWAIDEKPTGSSDPYALRRAALGVVRIILENGVRFGFRARAAAEGSPNDLLAFLADRLKVQLREQGRRHDLVDAVFALGDDDLVRIVARVEALSAFLASDDGANLLAGFRRAANILKAEEKKDPAIAAAIAARASVDADLLREAAERDLAEALGIAETAAKAAVCEERFAEAMAALAKLRAPVDRFFDQVLVNADEPALRRNRLLLLARIRDALAAVADFSKIEG